MQGRMLVVVLLALTCSFATVSNATTTSIPPASQPVSGPAAALERYAQAFRDRSPEAIAAVLTADYTMHQMGDSVLSFTVGNGREIELNVMRGMLHGVVRDGKTVMPAADSTGIILDGLAQGVDPEHPDSTQHYQVLTVTRAQWSVRLTNGTLLENRPAVNVFHVVRGDAAVLAEGQTADPDRWYIRRWLENVSGMRTALNEKKGDCGEQVPPAAAGAAGGPAIPTVLAIRPLGSPACATLQISCDLPGDEPAKVEVYDVSGRLVNRREVAVKAAGTLSIEAGAGTHLLPGVYWVRLRQAARRPSTRMVVVAR